MRDPLRLYHAIIWENDTTPGQRVTVWAKSLDEAHAELESKFGAGKVFRLHNEEDSKKVRGT
jgi:hypothetical protein